LLDGRVQQMFGGSLLIAGCSFIVPPSDRRIGVGNPAGSGYLYPGKPIACEQTSRCNDLLAEIDRWVARVMPERSPIAGVAFHTFVDDRGRSILMTRSGGNTWLAVVTLADGAQIGLTVGCGIGIHPEACFVNP